MPMSMSLAPRELVVAIVGMGMTQRLIEERTGIPQPTISKILNGKVDDVLSANYRRLQALHDELLAAKEAAEGAEVPEPIGPIPITETVLDITTEQRLRSKPHIGWPVTEADLDRNIEAKRDERLADALAQGMRPLGEG